MYEVAVLDVDSHLVKDVSSLMMLLVTCDSVLLGYAVDSSERIGAAGITYPTVDG